MQVLNGDFCLKLTLLSQEVHNINPRAHRTVRNSFKGPLPHKMCFSTCQKLIEGQMQVLVGDFCLKLTLSQSRGS